MIFYDLGRQKRRGSFSPSDRDRYEPRARYEEGTSPLDQLYACMHAYGHYAIIMLLDYRGGRARSPGYRNSRFPNPYDSDCPVPMRSFIDWFQYTHPEDFADDERATQEASKNGDSTLNIGVKGRYEKYRKNMIAKQVSALYWSESTSY